MPQSEIELLRSYLDGQRRHVLGIVEGLDEQSLRRPVLPSGWSCLGLIQHLSHDVERFWFRAVVAGEQTEIDAAEIDAWQIADGTSAEDVLADYRHQATRADEIIAATPLDTPPAWWPAELFGNWRMESLRQIVLHVMTETAAHAGHLDAARELIDGRQWLVLSG